MRRLGRLVPGRAHRTAGGVAVWGSRGFRDDHQRLADHLGDCRRLRDWARDRGIELDDHPDSLRALDAAAQGTEPERQLPRPDAGLYLGTVLVRNSPSAHWHVRRDGHPVVRLGSGRDVDVLALVRDQAPAGVPGLAAAYVRIVNG